MTSGQRRGVLIYGYFGAGNLGDDLLLAVAIGRLRPLLSDAHFYVRDHGDTGGLTGLGGDVTFTGIEAILADQSKSRVARLWTYLRAYSHLFRRCRWLVFAGGTVFHERDSLTSLALQFMICVLARIQGVRIAALGVGIADLHSACGRWLLRQIVARTELFLVRDEAALRQCAGTKARLTEDLVFANGDLQPIPKPHGGRTTIGLTVYPPVFNGPRTHDKSAALVEAIRSWKSQGHSIVFLVCQRKGATGGDEVVFDQLRSSLGSDAQMIETRILNADSRELSRQLAGIDVVCGMRFHTLVLAAMLGRPFVGIAHDNKVSEICRRFDTPFVTANHLGSPEILAGVEAVMNRNPEPAVLERSRRSADENFTAFATLTS